MINDQARNRTGELRHIGEVIGDTEPRYMFRKALEAVKTIPIEQVAAEYGEFKLQGPGRLLGRCVLPDHTDRTPSLTIYTERGRWKCYGCGMGGDVVDLEELAGRHLEVWTAVIALSERFGVELPVRSTRWHGWQAEKGRRHKELVRWRERRYQRRLYRLFAADGIAEIEDQDERAEEARRAWEELGTLARAWAIRSMS